MTADEWKVTQVRAADLEFEAKKLRVGSMYVHDDMNSWVACYGLRGLTFSRGDTAYSDTVARRIRDWLIELFPLGGAGGGG